LSVAESEDLLSIAVWTSLMTVSLSIRLRSSIIGFCLIAAVLFAQDNKKPPSITRLVGDWKRTSLCQVKPSPCHDEVIVLRMSNPRNDSGKISVQADKIVDGSPVTMAISDWTYDAEKGQLTWTMPNGTWELNLAADQMNGTLKLPNGTIYRKVHVAKTS
jgi:hypothetical protein